MFTVKVAGVVRYIGFGMQLSLLEGRTGADVGNTVVAHTAYFCDGAVNTAFKKKALGRNFGVDGGKAERRTNTGADTGSNTRTKSRANTRANTTANTGAKSGTNTGTNTGTDSRANTGSGRK